MKACVLKATVLQFVVDKNKSKVFFMSSKIIKMQSKRRNELPEPDDNFSYESDESENSLVNQWLAENYGMMKKSSSSIMMMSKSSISAVNQEQSFCRAPCRVTPAAKITTAVIKPCPQRNFNTPLQSAPLMMKRNGPLPPIGSHVTIDSEPPRMEHAVMTKSEDGLGLGLDKKKLNQSRWDRTNVEGRHFVHSPQSYGDVKSFSGYDRKPAWRPEEVGARLSHKDKLNTKVALESKLEELRKEIDKESKILENVATNVNKKDQILEQIVKSIGRENRVLDQIVKDVARENRVIEDLKEEERQMRLRMENVKGEVREAENDLREMKKDLHEGKTVAKKLKEEKEDLEKDLEERSGTKTSLEKELGELRNEIEEEVKKIETLRREKDELNAKIAIQKKEADDISSSLSSTKEYMTQICQEFETGKKLVEKLKRDENSMLDTLEKLLAEGEKAKECNRELKEKKSVLEGEVKAAEERLEQILQTEQRHKGRMNDDFSNGLSKETKQINEGGKSDSSEFEKLVKKGKDRLICYSQLNATEELDSLSEGENDLNMMKERIIFEKTSRENSEFQVKKTAVRDDRVITTTWNEERWKEEIIRINQFIKTSKRLFVQLKERQQFILKKLSRLLDESINRYQWDSEEKKMKCLLDDEMKMVQEKMKFIMEEMEEYKDKKSKLVFSISEMQNEIDEVIREKKDNLRELRRKLNHVVESVEKDRKRMLSYGKVIVPPFLRSEYMEEDHLRMVKEKISHAFEEEWRIREECERMMRDIEQLFVRKKELAERCIETVCNLDENEELSNVVKESDEVEHKKYQFGKQREEKKIKFRDLDTMLSAGEDNSCIVCSKGVGNRLLRKRQNQSTDIVKFWKDGHGFPKLLVIHLDLLKDEEEEDVKKTERCIGVRFPDFKIADLLLRTEKRILEMEKALKKLNNVRV